MKLPLSSMVLKSRPPVLAPPIFCWNRCWRFRWHKNLVNDSEVWRLLLLTAHSFETVVSINLWTMECYLRAISESSCLAIESLSNRGNRISVKKCRLGCIHATNKLDRPLISGRLKTIHHLCLPDVMWFLLHCWCDKSTRAKNNVEICDVFINVLFFMASHYIHERISNKTIKEWLLLVNGQDCWKLNEFKAIS